MAFEHKEGSASLFQNTRKTKETHPDYTGTGLFNGRKIKLSGWLKNGGKGQFVSLSIQHDGEGQPQAAQAPATYNSFLPPPKLSEAQTEPTPSAEDNNVPY